MTANSSTNAAGVLTTVIGTAAYIGGTLQVPAGESVNISISGTYAASVQLEQAVTGDQSAWQIPANGGPFAVANATKAFTYTAPGGPEAFYYIRFNATAYTSGTVTATATLVPKQTLTLTDDNGALILSGGPSGVTFAVPVTLADGSIVQQQFNAGGTTAAFAQAASPLGINKLAALAGTTSTLPAATGSGLAYKYVVSVVPTSNSHVITCSAALSTFVGALGSTVASSGAAKAYVPTAGASGTGSDTITLAPATTGADSIGDQIEITDIAVGVYAVKGVVSVGVGSQATPFSTVA
jgi:hypothetical protein